MTLATCICGRQIQLKRTFGPFAPKGKIWLHTDKDYFSTHMARPA